MLQNNKDLTYFRECSWTPEMFSRISQTEDNLCFFLKSREAVLQYLKWWNRTVWNSASTINIIPFEELTYLEIKYQNDEEIQWLIQTIKERNARLYELKMQWLNNLIDKHIYDNIRTTRYKGTQNLKLYTPYPGVRPEWN